MSNEYETELKRFIKGSLEHLERVGKDGMSITIEGTDNDTRKKFRAKIRIEKDIEEEQH